MYLYMIMEEKHTVSCWKLPYGSYIYFFSLRGFHSNYRGKNFLVVAISLFWGKIFLDFLFPSRGFYIEATIFLKFLFSLRGFHLLLLTQNLPVISVLFRITCYRGKLYPEFFFKERLPYENRGKLLPWVLFSLRGKVTWNCIFFPLKKCFVQNCGFLS